MQRTLSAVSAVLLGLAIMLTSVISSFAAPISPQPVQVTSNVEKVYHRRWYDRPGHRYGWYRNHREWRRDRYEWRRDRYDRRYWSDRGDYRRWNHNRRYYRYGGGGYTGGSGRSHQ